MNETEEEDDPVVQELDVFLSKELSDSMFVFQYPVRSANLPYDEVNHTESKMKPIQQKVHLELAIDTRCPNYSRSRGEQMAVNMQGSKGMNILGSGLLDKQTFVSSTAGVKTSTYALGAYVNGQIFLTPVKGIVELRPGLDHIDKASSAQKTAADSAGDASDEQDDEATVVRQKIRAKESEEAKARRLASYEFLRQQQEDEDFVRMRYHYVNDDFADTKRNKLLAIEPNPMSEFYMADAEYGSRLVTRNKIEKATLGDAFSLTDLSLLPLGDQVTTLMRRAGVLHFRRLLSMLPKDVVAGNIINHLQNAAVLIRGIWVVKSDVLYPKDWTSRFSAVSAGQMCRVRDYILWKFSQSMNVTREELDTLGKIPEEDEVQMLCNLATFDKSAHTTDWVFAHEDDVEFMRKFPEVVDREARIWHGKGKKLGDIWSKGDNNILATLGRSRRTSGKNQKIRGGGGDHQMSDQSDTDVENHQHVTQTAYAAPVSSRKRTREEEDDDLIDEIVAKDSRIESDDFQPIVNASYDANNEVDSTTQIEQRAALTEFVRKQLNEVAVLWLSMLRLRLHKHLAGLTPGHILGRGGISNSVLEQSLVEAGAHRMSSPTTNGEAVYLLPQRGDPRDVIRSAILDLLNGKSSLKIGSLRKKLTDANEEAPTDKELKAVLKEFCETRGGCWHLKGTIGTEL